MKVDVYVYAALKEAVGEGRFELDAGDDALVSDLLDRIVEEYPAARPFRPVMRGAIDDAYVRNDAPVVPGTELHVITPVSGG